MASNREEIEARNLKVLLIDECHLLWGDLTGYVWGKTDQEIAIIVQLPSNIITSTFGSGNSGNLTLVTKNLSVEGGGEILTSTFGAGKGGNLTVNTPESTQVIGYLSGASQLSSTQSQTQSSLTLLELETTSVDIDASATI